jgi:hypothetical protein
LSRFVLLTHQGFLMATDFNSLLEDNDQLCSGFAAIEASLTPKYREDLCALFLSLAGEPAERVGNNLVRSHTRFTCSKVGDLLTKHFGDIGPKYSMSWIGFIKSQDDGSEQWVMKRETREALRRLGWFGEGPATEYPEHADGEGDQEADFEERAERFALVKVRTEQAAFRNAVFADCGGCCVISGNAVPQALEAAHLRGRSWHEGHNAASDGVLLRRDLHALYDSSLMSIEEDGRVVFHPDVEPYYLDYVGKVVRAVAFDKLKKPRQA